MVLFLLLAVLLGRFTCGWICPMGFLQDTLANIRQFFKIKRIKVGKKAGKTMRKIGITLIFLVLILSAIVSSKHLPWAIRDSLYLSGCQICPTRIVAAVLTGYPFLLDIWRPMFVILFIICVSFLMLVLGSMFINRFWCRICPNGIILSYFNKGRCLVKKKDLLKCTKCGVCANMCLMETTRAYEEKDKNIIDHYECIGCFRCVEACPEKALKVKFLGMKIF